MGKKLNHGVVNFWPHASIKRVFFKNDQSDSYLGHITHIYTMFYVYIKLNIVQRHLFFRYLGESPQRRLNIEKTNEGVFGKFPQHPSLPVSGKVVFLATNQPTNQPHFFFKKTRLNRSMPGTGRAKYEMFKTQGIWMKDNSKHGRTLRK